VAANPVLEAFIKLFADDTRLKQQMGALRAEAEKAGADVSRAFEQGTARGGPALPQFGTTVAGRFGGIGGLGRAAGLAGAGRLGGLARLAGAHPGLAIGAGATLAAANYVKQIKAATEAEQELARAREGGDPAAVTALLTKRTTALRELEDTAREAIQPVTGLESAVRKALGTFAFAWEEIAGPGMAQRRKEVEDATKAAEDMWKAFGAPHLAIDSLKRSAAEMQANAQVAVKAAEDTLSYSAAVDMLITAKEKEAEASRKAIDLEIERIRLDQTKTVPQRMAEIGAAQERRADIEKKLARDRAQIEQDRRRQLGEMEATEIEHTAKITSLAQQRHDAIIDTLGSIVETEAATTSSLEQTFRARAALMAEGTRSALDALEKETAARRQAIQARMGGAVGQERVRLERELTLVAEEEATKRTQIEGRAMADRLRLVRQAQQEQIALQERVFAIQRSLGERSLHDDLARQTSIARGAQAGSQTQLRALEQVAQMTKALSDQAKEFLSSALAASDEVARKAGREPSRFVSATGIGASLAATTAERFTQLQAAERTFQAGGEIKREDFESLMRGELDRLRTQREAGLRTLAQNVGQTGIGVPAGDLTQAAFGEQIARAFEKPIDTFTSQVGPQFASMVSKAAPQFDEMTDLWSQAVDKMVKKAEDGSSKMGAALYETFKTRLARDLDREVKTF
jgi:hypothetical protein